MTGTDRGRFVERFALDWASDGFPRMSARAFAAILISPEGRLTAAELASELGASAAAVSGAVRLLIAAGLVERAREPGERRDTYRLLDDVWYESFGRADDRFARWAASLGEGMAAVEPGSAAEQRLADARSFFQFLRAEFPRLMAAWKEQRDR